ncbi:helix-turn-helix domain-containing protein [Phytomonospora sp. NPDC050363]|uniref:helix-turn-helix domain-containing protein n=1 Tax=Phytomonospora sp. NPDC050363 TaxID=3155642 RepID=UPI00340C0B1E
MTDERLTSPPRAGASRLWTVAELAAAVARALSHDYAGAGNGRVRDVPGVRVIRWYQTIGLVDRPVEMRGRTALYGPRHLRQIVAVKRLQSAGRSLAEIQEALVGAPDEVLERIARIPEGETAVFADASGPTAEMVDLESPSIPVEVDGADGEEPARGRFWADRAVAKPHVAVSEVAVSKAVGRLSLSDEVVPEVSYGIPLAPGLTVLVELPHPPGPDAIAAIRAAAAPLVAEVATHRQDGAFAPESPPRPQASPSPTTSTPAARGLTEGASS